MRYLLILLTLLAMLFVAGCGEPKVVAEIHHDEAGGHAEGEESHGEAGEEHAEGEESHSEGEETHAEDASAEGEHTEGETTEGEHTEDETTEGEHSETEEEPASDETSSAEGETPSSEPAAIELGPAATSLVESLQASGLEVVAVQPTETSPFSVQGYVVAVNEQPVIIFEYADAAAAAADAQLVSPDGTAIAGNELGTQGNATHFFHQENLIAIYLGEDEAILADLEAALGPRFAGGTSAE